MIDAWLEPDAEDFFQQELSYEEWEALLNEQAEMLFESQEAYDKYALTI